MLSPVHQFIDAELNSLIFIACATALELVSVDGERQGWVSRLRGLMFRLFYLAGLVIASMLLRQLATIVGLKPLLILDLRSIASSDNLAFAVLGLVALPFIPLLVGDFLFYCFHRLQHTVPLLWRFHAVHHAVEELNAANSSHHITEEFFRGSFFIVPLSLVQLRVPDVVFIGFLLSLQNALVHANSRISFGPLNYVIVGPIYHRVHHSMDILHYNRNFCTVFPIWDMLFGTAYFPAIKERIKTGLPDKCEAKTICQYLFALPSRKETIVAAQRTDTSEILGNGDEFAGASHAVVEDIN
jgi:sterol desaturase/sphingolipid hydroxylase (fatty acid hydroxylase superfamily)